MLSLISLESLLFSTCIYTVLVKIYGALPSHKKFICLIAIFYLPMILIYILGAPEIILILLRFLYIIIPPIISVISTKGIKYRHAFFSYLFIYGFTFAITTGIFLITDCFYNTQTFKNVLDLIINLTVFFLCLVACRNKWGKTIKIRLSLVSKKVKSLTIFSLWISAYLACLVADFPDIEATSEMFIVIRICVSLLILIIGICCPLLIISSMSDSYYKSQLKNAENQIVNQLLYYEKISKSDKEIRKFKHDYKNMNIGLTSLLSSNKLEEAKEYLKKQSEIFSSQNLIIFDTGNEVINALLTEKLEKAKSLNADINFEGSIPNKGINPVDLCIIFGNAIDNAIEACEKTSTKENKIISVTSKQRSNFLKITISNPVYSTISLKNGFPATTKADKSQHGFGLYSIDETVKKYNGELKIISDENQFTLEMYLDIV